MTLPTPTHQFFTTTNVLHDAISNTDILNQNHATNIVTNTTASIGGITVNCAYFSGALGSTWPTSNSPPDGDRAFLYSVDSDLTTPTYSFSFWGIIASFPSNTRSATAFYEKRKTGVAYTSGQVTSITTPVTIWNIPTSYIRFSNRVGSSYVTPTSTALPFPCSKIASYIYDITQVYNIPVFFIGTYDGTTLKLYSTKDGSFVSASKSVSFTGTSFTYTFGGEGNYTTLTNSKMYDFRIFNNVILDESQIQELYYSYITPTDPTGLALSPTYLYINQTLTATGSGSDTNYRYRFDNYTDSEILQDYSDTATYTPTSALKGKTIRVYVKGWNGSNYSTNAYTADILVRLPKQKLRFGTADKSIVVGP